MKYFLLVIVMVTFVCSGYSQIDEKYLLGTWKAVGARVCVDSVYQNSQFGADQMEFLADHRFTVHPAEGKNLKAKWELQDSVITITAKKGPFKMRVVEITSDRMEVELYPEDHIFAGKSYRFFITIARKE